MAKLGLVTLELMLADLRDPVYAGDIPVKMNPETARYDTAVRGDEYGFEDASVRGPGGEDDGCGCGGSGDGCGDEGCGGGCGGGGCGADMATTMANSMDAGASRGIGAMTGPINFRTTGPAEYGRPPSSADPVGDRDKTRDRSPRPDRKRLPWSFSPGSRIAS
ncbi:MAG: hypothetical protein WBK88_08985 [Methanothrix sp.]